ncbi:MAG: efflux RND transporter permease subunit [Candidatus Muirbacterium halophilum]|nr:efflux RND transporter permease subunit [Candidatus Muirbacterium halophilum]MCK9475154.1 efflux RND transporter permease subunit [Candidatus Muirbacterium halophilum]
MKIFNSPLGVIAFFILFLFLGLISFFKIPLSILPEINYPMMIIETSYKGAGASEVEKKVTEKIEKSVTVVSGLDYVKSFSYNEKSIIYLVFRQNDEINIDSLYTKVREKIETIWNALPEECDIPVIKFYDPQSFPFIILSFEKHNNLEKTKEKSDILKKRLESINGIAQANIRGIPEKKYFITFYHQKISNLGISYKKIFNTIKDNNFDFPGGEADISGSKASVNIKGAYKNIDDINKIPIEIDKVENKTIKLGDIAQIVSVNQEKDISFSGSERLSIIELHPSGNSNLVELSQKVKEIINENPDKINIAWDLSEYIKESIYEMYYAVFFSFIITFFVIYLFFREIKLSLIISSVIPFAIGINFLIMYILKVNLNIMSLSALAISVGIIVDNSLVVGEKLYYYKKLGNKNYISKTLKATMSPVISSVLTTIIAFVPVVWITGLPGRFYSQQAIAISSTLIISLFLAFFLIPSLFKVLFKGNINLKRKKSLTFYIKRAILVLSVFFYKKKFISVFFVFLSIILSVYLFKNVKTEFLPDYVEEQIYIRIECTRYSEDSITFEAANLGNFLSDITLKENYVISIDYNEKQITVIRKSQKNENKYEIFNKIKNYVVLRGLNYEIIKNPSWDIPEPFRLELKMDIYSDNMNTLYNIQEFMEENIDIPMTYKKVFSSNNIIIQPDISKMKLLGIDIEDIKYSLQAVLGKNIITDLFFDDVYTLEIVKNAVFTEISELTIISQNKTKVKLKEISEISEKKEIIPIIRKEGKRSIGFSFPVIDDIEEVIHSLEEKTADIDGNVEFSGIKDLKDNMIESMLKALIITIILIYLVLVMQYESFLLPLPVMIFIPVSYAGAFLSWYLFGISVNMMSMLGLVILTGITVNNSIILLSEYIRKKNIIKAVSSRINAVMITSITTISGALPMIVGSSKELRIPVAITLVFGILFSFIFNLLIFPAIMRIFRKYGNA